MPGGDVLITMTGHYDLGLVALSVVIAAAASYAALDLAGRAAAGGGPSRVGWLWGGATAMGVGVWSMHVVGMLAFRLPVAVEYDPALVVLALAAAVVASAIALHVTSGPSVDGATLLGGSASMAAGIGLMHHTGMAAMRLPARVLYDPALFAASVAIALAVALLSLWLASRLRTEGGRVGVLQRAVSALVMGASIGGLHYTAMAATHFIPTDLDLAAGAVVAPPVWLAVAVGLAVVLVTGLAVVGSLAGRPGAARRAPGGVR
jgi:diguanylate cyclase